MPWKIFKRAEKDPEPVKEKTANLKDICEKYGRPDLYKPLFNTLSGDPKWFLTQTRPLSPFYQGCINLFKKQPEEARKNFEKTLEDPAYKSHYKPHVEKILGNFDVVEKIAIDWWTQRGLYNETKKEEQEPKPKP